MIFTDNAHTMGAGTSIELAVDMMSIIDSILESENSKEIIDNIVKCNYETDSNTLKEFAQILINSMEELLKA